MAEYRKIDWKVQREGKQVYIRDNVVRKPRIEEDPYIEHAHKRQGEINRERRKKQEFAQAMNRRYISFLLVSAILVFVAVSGYLTQIFKYNESKKNVQALESEVTDLKADNDETKGRLDTSINVEEIRRIAMEELGMVYAGQDQVVAYSYEESDYVRQYEDIPK